jgi:PBP1b-binding outer membrane lipoprotein LpoB
MTTTFTQYLFAILFMTAVLSSCSRPVAYFQREPINLATTVKSQPVAEPTFNGAPALPEEPIIDTIITTSHPEAYARNDSKLALGKTLRKRMNQMERLLVSTHEPLGPTVSYAVRKMNTVERRMVKKINKSNSQQLAPDQPKKAMADRIKLFGGILLLVVGAVIMLAASKSILFLGIILALAGIVGIIAGLFGIN